MIPFPTPTTGEVEQAMEWAQRYLVRQQELRAELRDRYSPGPYLLYARVLVYLADAASARAAIDWLNKEVP